MSSLLKANSISAATGTTVTIPSGTTLDIASGATLDTTGATVSGLTTGKVLQVLSMTYNTETYSTSATFSDTGLTLAITPSATSSKVFVLSQIKTTGQDNSSTRGGKVGLQILKGASIIYGPINTGIYLGGPSSVNRQSQNWNQLQYLDSPSTTSATTYKLQFNCVDDGAWANADGEMGIFTLMEIGA
jgi:hypothetical protein